jgi:hypothetical protein
MLTFNIDDYIEATPTARRKRIYDTMSEGTVAKSLAAFEHHHQHKELAGGVRDWRTVNALLNPVAVTQYGKGVLEATFQFFDIIADLTVSVVDSPGLMRQRKFSVLMTEGVTGVTSTFDTYPEALGAILSHFILHGVVTERDALAELIRRIGPGATVPTYSTAKETIRTDNRLFDGLPDLVEPPVGSIASGFKHEMARQVEADTGGEG